MRAIARFFVVWMLGVVLIPAVSNAADSQVCAGGATGNPTGKREFRLGQGVAEHVRGYLQQVVCANACFDETITFSVAPASSALKVEVVAVNKCKKSSEDPKGLDPEKSLRGCQKGQKLTPPTAIAKISSIKVPSLLSIPERTIGPKSRCVEALAEDITKAITAIAGSGLPDTKEIADALNQLNDSTPDVSTGSLNNGTNRALSDVLQERLGLDAESAERIVNSGNTEAALRAIADNDEAGLRKALEDSDVQLNKGVLDNFKKLSDEKRAETAAILDDPEWLSPSTFDKLGPSGEKNRLAEILAPMCQQLGGCGSACVQRPSSLVCRTNNPGAVVASAIASRFGCQACGQTNNTACCPSMENGIALQTALLSTSNRYFAGGNNSILGAICNGYAASNCGMYAQFVARQVGISPNQTIDPRNTELMGKIVMAMSRFENGRGVIFSPEQLQAGLEIAYGTRELPKGTPDFISKFLAGTQGAGIRFNSPFNFLEGPISRTSQSLGGTYGGGVGGGIAAPSSGFTPSPPSAQISQQQALQKEVSSLAARLQQSLGLGGTPIDAQPPVQPVASIIVQPKEIVPGNPLLVSWSSVGIRTSDPCQVYLRSEGTNTFFARGNEGSRTLITRATSTRGVWSFTLQCVSASGMLLEREASTLIK